MKALRNLVDVEVKEVKEDLPYAGKYGKKVLGTPQSKWKSCFTAQGDGILIQCGSEKAKKLFTKYFDSIPADAQKLDTNVVVRGNTNIHALFEGNFEVYQQKSGQTFVRVLDAALLAHMEPSGLKHAEHHAQWIPKGDYYIGDLFETDHIRDERRIALD